MKLAPVRVFSCKHPLTKKFLEVSRCSRAKQWQRNAQKKCPARAKLLLLIRPIVVFTVFRRCMPSPLIQFFKQRPAYKKGGPDPNKGSNLSA